MTWAEDRAYSPNVCVALPPNSEQTPRQGVMATETFPGEFGPTQKLRHDQTTRETTTNGRRREGQYASCILPNSLSCHLLRGLCVYLGPHFPSRALSVLSTRFTGQHLHETAGKSSLPSLTSALASTLMQLRANQVFSKHVPCQFGPHPCASVPSLFALSGPNAADSCLSCCRAAQLLSWNEAGLRLDLIMLWDSRTRCVSYSSTSCDRNPLFRCPP
jgi:hypothetical protein